MSIAKTRWVLLGLAALDLLFFGGWVGVETFHLRETQVRLPVNGYDPRDLLSGHYVRITLRAEQEARAMDAKADAYCLAQGPDGLSHVSSVKAPGNNCWPFLANVGRPESGEPPQFGVERFFVDERSEFTQREISRADDAYLVATVDRDGRLHPFDLVVAGQSIHRRKHQ